MSVLKPALKKIRGGYSISFGPYATKVLVGVRGTGTLALNVTTYLGKQAVASLNGTRHDDFVRFYEAFPSEHISRADGLRALGVLFPCTEMALRKAGIEIVGGRTHYTFAKFLKENGWKIVGKSATLADVEKNILKAKPVFLFRPRAPKKRVFTKKKTVRRRRL